MSPEPASPPVSPPSPGEPGAGRLFALDALRGFDMFWIIGAEEIVHAIHKAGPGTIGSFFERQLTHKDWAGIAFYDLIFPLFVFIVGVSLVFSLSKIIAQHGKAAACRRILLRSFVLYLVGIYYYGGFAKTIDDIRLMGVLQRIALCYCFAGLIFCAFRLRGMVIACAVLLIGYWALMTFVPVPGVGAGHFEERANLANYVDREYLPLRKWDGDHDPEGLLSTLPAIGTCLLGVFAGLLLRHPNLSPQAKVGRLVAGGLLAIVAGYLWGLQFPIIKKLWTSSYVLVAGGYAALLLALFYQVTEIQRWRRWAEPFVWIGMNPITLYLAWEFVPFGELANRLAGGPIKAAFGVYGDAMIATVMLGLIFLLARILYSRRIFLRL